MFFIMDLQHTMKLHPSYFGPNIRQFLRQKLIADVEGTCNGQYGYIICVLDDNDLRIPPGKIIPGQGSAEFRVRYRAIVWKPFKVNDKNSRAVLMISLASRIRYLTEALTFLAERSGRCNCVGRQQDGFLCRCGTFVRICVDTCQTAEKKSRRFD